MLKMTDMHVTSKQRPKGSVGVSQVNKWYRTRICLGERKAVQAGKKKVCRKRQR